jgi:hypothetical protein
VATTSRTRSSARSSVTARLTSSSIARVLCAHRRARPNWWHQQDLKQRPLGEAARRLAHHHGD